MSLLPKPPSARVSTMSGRSPRVPACDVAIHTRTRFHSAPRPTASGCANRNFLLRSLSLRSAPRCATTGSAQCPQSTRACGHEIVGRIVRVGSAVKKFKEAIWRLSVAWSAPAGCAKTAAMLLSSTAQSFPFSPKTLRYKILGCRPGNAPEHAHPAASSYRKRRDVSAASGRSAPRIGAALPAALVAGIKRNRLPARIRRRKLVFSRVPRVGRCDPKPVARSTTA